MRTRAKKAQGACGRCKTRIKRVKERRVHGYGYVCIPCYGLCTPNLEAFAAALAGLATGEIKPRLGFHPYRKGRAANA